MSYANKDLPGWAFVTGSTKAHFFLEDRRSVCGRWAALGGHYFDTTPPDEYLTCQACERRWETGKYKQAQAHG